ncbi:MAG: FixH family protein [Acidobacteriota bacterium]
MTAKARWVGVIVGLLVGNVAATGVLIAASHDGASRVIPAYYDQAIHYDDVMAQARRNVELGWRVELAPDLTVRVHDRAGAPIDDARVHLAGYTRASGAPVDANLVRAGAGVYRGSVAHGRGWQDLTVTVARGGDKYVAREAIEAR